MIAKDDTQAELAVTPPYAGSVWTRRAPWESATLQPEHSYACAPPTARACRPRGRLVRPLLPGPPDRGRGSRSRRGGCTQGERRRALRSDPPACPPLGAAERSTDRRPVGTGARSVTTGGGPPRHARLAGAHGAIPEPAPPVPGRRPPRRRIRFDSPRPVTKQMPRAQSAALPQSTGRR